MSRDLKLNGTIEAAGYSGGPVSGTTGTFSAGVSGTTGAFSGAVSGASGAFSGAIAGPKCKITAEGGIAVQLTNESGVASVKGQIVSSKGTVARAFDLTPVDANHVLGVVYEDGIADAAECWVVVGGIAQVLMKNAATMGHICRIPLTADDGEAAGYAMDAAQSGTASVYKIGDVLETQDAEVLCRVLLSRY